MDKRSYLVPLLALLVFAGSAERSRGASSGAIDLSTVERPGDDELVELLPPNEGLPPAPLPETLRLAVVRNRGRAGGKDEVPSPLRARAHADGRLLAGVPSELRVLVHPAESTAGWCRVEVIDFTEAKRHGFMRREHLRFIDLDRPYQDLRKEHWAYPAIAELTQEGLLQGSAGRFLGKKPFSRFEMATVLARLVRQLRLQKSGLIERVDRLSQTLDGLARRDLPRDKAAEGADDHGRRTLSHVEAPRGLGEPPRGLGELTRRLEQLEASQRRMQSMMTRLLACGSVNRVLCEGLREDADRNRPLLARSGKVDGLLSGLAVTRASLENLQTRVKGVERQIRSLRRRRPRRPS